MSVAPADRLRGFFYDTKRRDQVVGYALIILGWELLGRMTSNLVFPTFSSVVVTFYEVYTSPEIYEALAVSVQQMIVGFLIAAVFALFLGFLMGRSNAVEYVFDTYVNVLFVTSYAALLPLLIILFGVGFKFRVAVVFLSSVFHMIFTFKAGAENVDKDLMDAARVFGASDRQLYLNVLLPAALPFLIAGLRLGIGRAWKGMVVAELWVVVGVGALLDAYRTNLAVPELFVLLITLMVLGAGSVKALYWLQRRFAPWESDPSFG